MSTEQHEDRSRTAGISRRSVLSAGAIGIPGLALVACSQAKTPAGDQAAQSSSTAGSGSATTGSSGAASPSSTASSASAGTGAALAKLSDIKVGGAISAKGPDGANIIITRPTKTTVAAYSAICTHQGCTVKPVGKELDCPCHGSVFDLTGAVVNGPAQRPLRAVQVTLSGDDVVAG
jgi:cytochrome b6-f complex iron-sulfur subunit